MLTEKKLLIVDDEKGVRHALIRGIRHKFNKQSNLVSISEASNGQEAIDKANNTPPDLILMDIRMPIMNGLKACRILRSDSKFAATKIIILTCEITEESEGLLSGADDYVIKPFDIKTLLIRIERGLFQPRLESNPVMLDDNGLITKECFFDTCISYEVARAKRFHHPLSLLLFKVELRNVVELNDNHHESLINIFKRRTSDKVVHWGEKTFALLLTETDANDATLLAKHIAHKIEHRLGFLRAYVGIANLEDTLCDDIIGNAESSLREALRTGNIILNRLAVP